MDVNKKKYYKNFKYIGEGGFSVVFRADYVPDSTNEDMDQESRVVAVKKIKMRARKPRLSERIIRTLSNRKSQKGKKKGNAINFGDVKNELDICEAVSNHKFVLDILDSLFIAKDEFWIVFEYTLGDLHNIIRASKSLPQNKKRQRYLPINLTRHLVAPIISAVKYMHESGYVHLDIKEDNILLTHRGVPKLSDFGAAKEFIDLPMKLSKKGPGGTFYYMSPEILRVEPFTTNCDTWAIGITLISLVYGGRPFELQSKFKLNNLLEFLKTKSREQDAAHQENQNRISAQDRFYRLASLNAKPIRELPDKDFTGFSTFVKKLLVLDQYERPEVAQICNDEYIAGYNTNWNNVNVDQRKQKLRLNTESFEANEDTPVFLENCAQISKYIRSLKAEKKQQSFM